MKWMDVTIHPFSTTIPSLASCIPSLGTPVSLWQPDRHPRKQGPRFLPVSTVHTCHVWMVCGGSLVFIPPRSI
ncbi:hypothetical protein BJX68DRAFT_227949 [Aspergillus pseudodeflectus]|uniref:Uncharacterized protein n=1 Tax=Aspergillus pseudodeflectus TaxID=176178 RepID=A0ABR4L0Q9_9EURO